MDWDRIEGNWKQFKQKAQEKLHQIIPRAAISLEKAYARWKLTKRTPNTKSVAKETPAIRPSAPSPLM